MVTLGGLGTVAAVNVLPAQAAHALPAQAAHHRSGVCVPPPSPKLAGFKQGMVAIPGDSLHYVIGGSGPVLVLMHGWPMTWWEWHTVMPDLAKTHTVIAFDLPGLGNSTVPTSGGYTTPDTAARLREAVVALGYNNISILSHDLGVNIAYAYARLYPQSVSRLMVLESLLNGYGLESIYAFSFHFDLNMAAPPTPERIINNREAEVAYLNYLYSFAAKPGAITSQDKKIWYGAYSCPANREAGYNYYRAMPQDETWDTSTNTSKLTIPIVAMGGEDSFGTGVATSFDNVDSDVSSIVAPGSGHYIPEEDPGFLTECANLFFSSDPNEKAPSGFSACVP
ncbi:MAG: alpha/beta hydrolase [Actinomycetota bacterium]|nr:alpha/beta hydrolase [Actinomycetota bacterium]